MRSFAAPSSSGRSVTLPCSQARSQRIRGRLVIRAMRDMGTDRRPIVPSAPPLRESIPPPPPPSNTGAEGSDWKPSRRDLFAILLAGGLGMYGLQKTVLDETPTIYRGSKETGGYFVKSAKGNVLRIFTDKEGRVWFLDKRGNFYYDTDIAGGGFYAYTVDGNVYNLYEDENRKPASKFVGRISDLRVLKTKELGQVIAFEDGRQLPLPPGAFSVELDPVTGQPIRAVLPPVLEEGYLALEKRTNLLESLLPSGPIKLESFNRGEPLL